MRHRRATAWVVAGPILVVLAAAVADRRPSAEVERGKHIVHDVAMCVQCHSPRGASGELSPERLLEGAAIPVASPFAEMPWATRAPHLRGLPGYDEAAFVRLLTEGVTARGGTPRPPMPPFRLDEAEARAVYAYLAALD